MQKHIIPIVIIIIFSFFGLKSLLHPGLITGHDIWHQVARLYWYEKAISDGQFPPYWISSLSHGLGYPLFFFSYHLPWLVAYPFLKLGISIFDTIKILFGISYLFSGIFMYLFVYNLLKSKTSAILSTILYLWAPYRFLNIFVFGAMGTSFVFVFLPLLLLGIYKLLQHRSSSGIILTAIGLAGIILSHFITLFSIIPPLVLLVISGAEGKLKLELLKNMSLGALLGIGISAFYFLPAAFYGHLTQLSSGAFNKIYETNFLQLKDILYSKWDFGTTNFSAQLGIAQWVVLASTLFAFKRSKLVLPFFISFWISLFMMLAYSEPVWDFLTRFVSLDFPSMFLLPAVFCSAILGGVVYQNTKKVLKPFFFIALILITLYTNRNYRQVNLYTNFSITDYIGAETTTNSYHEYFPKNANVDLLTIDQNYAILPKEIKVENTKRTTKELSFIANLPKTQDVSVKQLVFPGQNLYIDNKKENYTTDSQGRIAATLEKGMRLVSIKFEETGLIKAAKGISLISLFALGYLIAKHVKKEI